MAEERVIADRFVGEAEDVLRRAAGMREEWELQQYMGFDVRKLVAQIAVALEGAERRASAVDAELRLRRVLEVRMGGSGVEPVPTFADAAQWLRENPELRVDDSEWPGWEDANE